MYAVLGVTGQVGSAVGASIVESGAGLRAIVRSSAKGAPWAARGTETAIADLSDVPALTRALRGVEGAFVMLPPAFSPSPGFPEAKRLAGALRQALADARPPKTVVLSTIGAERSTGIGILHGLHILERELAALSSPVAFLRAAWFVENAAWDVASARDHGEIQSFLQPLDRAFPMVSTDDVGRVAAETLLGPQWRGRRAIALEGPSRVSPHDLARALGNALERTVTARAVPRETWATIFEGQGSAWPAPRVEMLDGFNSGWIDFHADDDAEHRFGRVTVGDVAHKLVAAAR